MTAQLPTSFDLDDFENFFSMTLARNNILACKRVIRKLISGEGVKHKAKPGEAFALGRVITPNDDLVALKLEAKEWLPHTGPNALDKGHGWALAHPIQKLIEYKNHLRAQAMNSISHMDDPDDGSEYDVPGYREAEKEYEEYLASGGYRSGPSSENESVDPDEFEVKDSDISDNGESEPSDGESLGSQDSERSEESEGSEDKDEDESVAYESEEEDELDRLDALAEIVTHATKRQRAVESDEEEYDKKMIVYLRDCGR